MRSLCIRNVRAVDANRDSICDILLQDGKIAAIGTTLAATADIEIDGSGLTAMPGLFDMHVHFRDPGQTHKEDLQSGTAAALAGGITGVLCMPNTVPPMDNADTVEAFLARAAHCGIHVYQTGCLTKKMQGKALADYDALQTAGVAALSDDGRPVADTRLMEQTMIQAAARDIPVVSHCEDLHIINGGIINKGEISARLGVKGMDRASEDSITAREIALAKKNHVPIHICHVSTKGSIESIRAAKAEGVNVTCETAPHYFMLTDEKLLSRDANYRMNPPLRTADDVKAVIEGILDGTVDCIITDHAPHAPHEKADFEKAPNGIVGLETSLAATLTALYHTGLVRLQQIVAMMYNHPRNILHLPADGIAEGAVADMILVDTEKEWIVDPAKLHSKSHNTAFQGMTLKGKNQVTIVGGIIRYADDRFAAYL